MQRAQNDNNDIQQPQLNESQDDDKDFNFGTEHDATSNRQSVASRNPQRQNEVELKDLQAQNDGEQNSNKNDDNQEDEKDDKEYDNQLQEQQQDQSNQNQNANNIQINQQNAEQNKGSTGNQTNLANSVAQPQNQAQPVQPVQPAQNQNPAAQNNPKVQNDSLSKYRTLSICFIALEAFLVVGFLEFLMEFKNCVPQREGIILSRTTSVGYFAFTLIMLALLIFNYKSVQYCIKSVLTVQVYVTLLIGILILCLGFVIFFVEIPQVNEAVDLKWSTLSNNQMLYFDNDKANLVTERSVNTTFCGIFAIVIGISTIILAILMLLLNRQIGEKYVPVQQASRFPSYEAHEQVKFKNAGRIAVSKDNQFTHAQRHKPDLKDKDDEEIGLTNGSDENSQDDGDALDRDFIREQEEQRRRKEYGSVPGEQLYQQNDYQNYNQSNMYNNGSNMNQGYYNNNGNNMYNRSQNEFQSHSGFGHQQQQYQYQQPQTMDRFGQSNAFNGQQNYNDGFTATGQDFRRNNQFDQNYQNQQQMNRTSDNFRPNQLDQRPRYQ